MLIESMIKKTLGIKSHVVKSVTEDDTVFLFAWMYTSADGFPVRLVAN